MRWIFEQLNKGVTYKTMDEARAAYREAAVADSCPGNEIPVPPEDVID